jgi:ABC-type multidrug transport system fused ATPase/permease subunit
MNKQNLIKVLNFAFIISLILGLGLLSKNIYNLYNLTGVISVPYIFGQILGIAIIPVVILIIIISIKRKLKNNNVFENKASKSDEAFNLEKNVKMIEQLVHDKVLTSDEAKIKLNEISERLKMLKSENREEKTDEEFILSQIENYKLAYKRFFETSRILPIRKKDWDHLIEQEKYLTDEIVEEIKWECVINNARKHEPFSLGLIIILISYVDDSPIFNKIRILIALIGIIYFLNINYKLYRQRFKFIKFNYIIGRIIAFIYFLITSLFFIYSSNTYLVKSFQVGEVVMGIAVIAFLVALRELTEKKL